MTRGNILLEAHNIINGERQDQYGNPEDAFQSIANIWTEYFDIKHDKIHHRRFFRKDVAIMLALMKIVREANQGKRDNLIDACGYLALAGDMED